MNFVKSQISAGMLGNLRKTSGDKDLMKLSKDSDSSFKLSGGFIYSLEDLC